MLTIVDVTDGGRDDGLFRTGLSGGISDAFSTNFLAKITKPAAKPVQSAQQQNDEEEDVVL